jgi:hypothetical protein
MEEFHAFKSTLVLLIKNVLWLMIYNGWPP